MKRWAWRIVVGVSLAVAALFVALWAQSYAGGFHTPMNGVHYPAFGHSWSFGSRDGALVVRWNEILARGQRKWVSTEYWNFQQQFHVITFNHAPTGMPAAPNRVWASHGVIAARYWFLALFAIQPTIAYIFFCYRQSKSIRRAGFCRQCGYDLRASPDRCPECGAPVASLPAST